MAQATHLTCEYTSNPLGIDTAHPRFSWWMDDQRPGAAQSAYHLQVASEPFASGAKGAAGGESAVTASSPDGLVWESGEVTGDASVHVVYAGDALASRTRYHWRVRIRDHQEQWGEWSEPSWFETAFLSQDEWQANWIGPSDEDEAGGPPEGPHDAAASPYLRTGFAASGAVASARLYLAARGFAEVSLNGHPVSTDVFVPGWTDYDERCQYVTCDVTDLVAEGANAIGAILGDGWYSGRIARIRDKHRRFGARPQLLCELHLTYADGREDVVLSDASWTWRTGPIRFSDIYDGESYDAREELEGWDRADGSSAPDGASGDTAWQPVRVVGGASARWDGTEPDAAADGSSTFVTFAVLAAAGNDEAAARAGSRQARPVLDAKVVPPVRRVQEIAPVAQTEPAAGRYVYDLGQNIVGWARVKLAAPAGTTITLRFAEMLNPDGTLYVENLRSARATDTYVTASDEPFEWEPRFTFHGFRYVEVSGVEGAPAPEQIVGIVVHNDLEFTGRFACSHEKVNRLQQNIQWGQRGNYLEAPTDCPQRDERLGWTGDAQVFIPTAAFNMNVAPFFAKWQRDLVDSQGPEGTIPSVAPAIRYMTPAEGNDGGPAWSDAFVICPWIVREKYGDTRIIEEAYDAMWKFIESMRKRSRGLISSDEFVEKWGGYGDWVSMDAPEDSRVGATPKDLIGTAYFAHSVDLMRQMAELLGRKRDVVTLRDLHTRIVRAFQAEYVTPQGRLLGDTQTSYVVALAFDVLPEGLRQSAVDRLVRLLEQRGWRLSTGFVGTPLLCPVLTRFGRVDVAYRLLLQEEFPSWLYTVNQGATTMWERWNSYTHERGFGPVEMNSFNHYAYGSIGDWMYSTVAGLRVDLSNPAEPPLRIAPIPGFGLTSASAELETPYGRTASGWTIDDGRVTLDVRVPANASARVIIPAGNQDIEIDADEGESRLEELVIHEENENGVFRFRVAAGEYRFVWRVE